ncbi:hypothetical protein ACHAWF_014983 [Thalassiosira exigua]
MAPDRASSSSGRGDPPPSPSSSEAAETAAPAAASASSSTRAAAASPPPPPPLRPLVDRRSNPIIGEEEDDDDGGGDGGERRDGSDDGDAGESDRGGGCGSGGGTPLGKSTSTSSLSELVHLAGDEAEAQVAARAAARAAVRAAPGSASTRSAAAGSGSRPRSDESILNLVSLAGDEALEGVGGSTAAPGASAEGPTSTPLRPARPPSEGASGRPTTSAEASTSAELAVAASPSVEASLSGSGAVVVVQSAGASPVGGGGYLPSQAGFEGGPSPISADDDPALNASLRVSYLPPALSRGDGSAQSAAPNSVAFGGAAMEPSSPSSFSASSAPESAAPSPASSDRPPPSLALPSDADATRHGRRRGSGYLASRDSLATPADQFAAGCTLLQLCAIGDPDAVRSYVATTFSNVNFRDYDRRTALHVASSEGRLDVVRFLAGRGATVNRSDRWGGSPLDDAHRHRHADVARYLRSKGGRTGSVDLTSHLIAAAAAGDIEEVTMIVASGDPASSSALDLSGSKGRHLPGGGGGGNRATSPGNDGSESRRGHGHKRISSVQVLDGSVGGRSGHRRISSAPGVHSSSLDVSEPKATRSAVDVDAGDYDQRTALHLAAGEGHLDVVQFLCQRGANANVEDRWGGRPLDDAVQKGHERVAEVLRRYGATAADEGPGQPSNHRSSHTLSGSAIEEAFSPPDEDENLRVDFSELEMIERIGSGAFGEIYKCRWRGILVAAKCIKASKIQKEWLLKNKPNMKDVDRIKQRVEAIKQTSITEEEKQLALEDFRRETAILRRLRHPNVVMMLAYSHTEDVEVMISEICRCSLLDIFKANSLSNSRIPKRTQVRYAQQLAQGMNHLHKSRPPIIHRDLKPANLLVDFNGTLKIADFGLAKIRPNPEHTEEQTFLMTGETGSYRFMAPEVFRHEEYTETVDVYSYAMIFYYMLVGAPPWRGLSGLDAVTKAAVDGERPLIPRNVDERLSTLLKGCWDEDPRGRPSFEEIIARLNDYSRDVFKTKDGEVQTSVSGHDVKCGCVIS